MNDTPTPKRGITEIGQHDISELLAPRPRSQELRGFDPEYADIVDYIIRCTHRIWEEKGVGLIYSHYRHNAVVHTPAGTGHGVEAVVAATLQTLLAFPDRRLFGDAVVWSGDAARGFYTSHRITNTGTNTGPSSWGAATGRRCTWRGIADCVVLENRVCEEWLVRDDMHLCRQLGFDPDTVARGLAAADAARGVVVETGAELARGLGQQPPASPPQPDGNDAEAGVRWFLAEIWNGRRLDRVRAFYAPHAVAFVPGGRKLHGGNEVTFHLLQLLAAVPDGALGVEHVNSTTEAGRGTTVAVRWRFSGTHLGPGLFGPPSGQRVALLGISHFRLEAGQVAEEWTVFDTLSVLRQIHLQSG